jgi:anionic cell wall polymer biosynthesis LytR-Cps2A-Psr (LCP) family protein
MRTFVNIVNAVGGIDVNIPDKETSRTADLPVGENHLSGAEALKLVRNREGGTFERADNQSLVICALRKKLTSPSVVTQIPELIESFQDNVRTDFTPEQLSQLACLGTQMPPQNIQLVSFPSEHFKQTRTFDPVFDKRISILDADFDILREYVAQFQAGTWPTTSSDLTDEETEEDTPIICE